MSDRTPATSQKRGPRLIDLLGLVIGFGTAAILMKSLWPASRSLAPQVLLVAGILYAWLGLAMAGPILLLIDRRGFGDATRRLSWAQVAWLLIGSYWLIICALVVPLRLEVHPLLGLFPILAAILLRFLGPNTGQARITERGWTDRVAFGLMLGWPVAWGCLILLGKTLY